MHARGPLAGTGGNRSGICIVCNRSNESSGRGTGGRSTVDNPIKPEKIAQ